MIEYVRQGYIDDLGLEYFWKVEWEKYNHRPYLDANYWVRFDKWLESNDIMVDRKTQTVYFKTDEQKTMFLLTYPPSSYSINA